MKKISILLLLLLSFILVSCQEVEEVEVYRLPDLEGMVKEDIIDYFSAYDFEIEFVELDVELNQSYEFIRYGASLRVGSRVPQNHPVYIVISRLRIEDREFFSLKDIDYDGPLLDESFFLIDNFFEDTGERIIGTGKAFEVGYDLSRGIGRCIDGDTTVFGLPFDLRVQVGSVSLRYLNVDTPETNPFDRREPFGKVATEYVCDLLDQAERVVVQTDPGDRLTDHYGRLLGWVWIQLPEEDEFWLLNYMIVRQGLGEVAYLFGAGSAPTMVHEGMSYTQWMLRAELQAKDERLGIFGDDLDWYWDYFMNRPHPTRWP